MLRTLAGGPLLGEQWGEEPPAVLALHGWRRTHEDFVAVLGPTSPGGALDAVAPDLPGFGATPAPDRGWGSEEYAASLIPLLEHHRPDARPVVVLGHSFGGRVAVTLAARRPDLVAGVVLSGAPVLPLPGGPRRSPKRYRAVRGLRRAGLVPESVLERARQRFGSEDYRAATGVMREIMVRLVSERYDEHLAALSGPVELVWGDDDPAAPLAIAEGLTDVVAGAHLVVCPGAGHLTPLTAPAALRTAVERCLERVASAA
jgi:pimeloyl-ACP methyl ester carboxylesterase